MQKVKTDLAPVFSAHAEVVPLRYHPRGTIAGILRARGGSSLTRGYGRLILQYSPRTRR